MWTQIFTAGGTLSKGFVGQISYTVCLEKEYNELDILFSFDKEKQYYKNITNELIEEVKNICGGDYEVDSLAKEEITDIISGMKTEIHTIATMNDTFIGGIHRQLCERHMTFSKTYATKGCIPQSSIHGVIHVTLVVFNVILPDTDYTITVSVR